MSNASTCSNYSTYYRRFKVPSLEEFLEPLKEEMNPEHDIEKAYRLSNKEVRHHSENYFDLTADTSHMFGKH